MTWANTNRGAVRSGVSAMWSKAFWRASGWEGAFSLEGEGRSRPCGTADFKVDGVARG
jgi:hypothetical protein